MTEAKVRVEAVRVEGRHRRDLGNIAGLAKSIEREGLIQAIVVTPQMRLLAGERRLEAARMLGWETIDARIIDTLDDALTRLRIERDENTERKSMLPSELVALGLALEELERPKAAARAAQAPGQRQGTKVSSGHVTGGDRSTGETEGIVAPAIGMSRTSYQRAKKVVAAAEDTSLPEEDRACAQEALADMDRTGNIAGNYNRVKKSILGRTGARHRVPLVTAKSQRRAIAAAETVLAGVSHGLEQITELHPDITSEEAAHWLGSLTESRRVITSLINYLRERSKCTSQN